MKYSVKKVIVGCISNVNKKQMGEYNNRVGIIIPENKEEHICVIDKKKKQAIDIFEPTNTYPLFGTQDGNYVVSNTEVEENKQYVLKMEKLPFSYRDQRNIIKQVRSQIEM